MSTVSKLVHLVYIHGFQGSDASFQSFPLDLQNHLSQHIPAHLTIKIQSSIYPTYKSVKPLSYATKNFLEWLQTQPPGPVILLGHSMGGLLAAEAATDPSNAPDEATGKPRRIVAVIAFDTPYLGMHPHVVVSGIASLFPKDGGKGDAEAERKMNAHPDINVVPDEVTDDWEEMKRSVDLERAHSQSDAASSHLSVASVPTSSARSSLGSRPLSPSPLLDRALDFMSSPSENPLVRWYTKYLVDPSEIKRLIVETLQFGSAMFDPSGLKERYIRLVNWKSGMWVNYWTLTVPRNLDGTPLHDGRDEHKNDGLAYNDYALVESGIVQAPGEEGQSSIEKEWRRQIGKLKGVGEKRKQAKEKIKSAQHFIVLPTGLGKHLGGGENWEKVTISGVYDEVEAHTGLFIRDKNLDYNGFLDKVGKQVIRWCERL